MAARLSLPGGAFPAMKRQSNLNLLTEAATAYAGYAARQGGGLPQTDHVLFRKVRNLLPVERALIRVIRWQLLLASRSEIAQTGKLRMPSRICFYLF